MPRLPNVVTCMEETYDALNGPAAQIKLPNVTTCMEDYSHSYCPEQRHT